MSYERTFWKNGETPINADNLNKLEEGVSANAEALSTLNDDVSALTEEVGNKALQADVDALEGTVESLGSNVGTLETNVGTMQTDVGTLQTDVSTLRSDVDDLIASSGGETPTGLLYESDVVDNLLSTATNLPLSANQGRVLKEGLDDCFQSVSNGKALVASAITDKGVTTDATATFEQMALNISDIEAGAEPSAGNAKTTSNGHSTAGTGTSTTTPSITLPANGTYLVTFVACQSSADYTAENSSLTLGSFSISGTSIVENAITTRTGSSANFHGGTTRLYSQSILVTTDASDVTISRTATAGGYGGNVIATIYAIKLY